MHKDLFYDKFISCLYMFRARVLIIRRSKLYYTASGIITLKQVSRLKLLKYSVGKKNQIDVTFCILYFSSNSCSTCFGQPCAHHQELTTA